MPIYAATMGGKMILDGKWLLSATLQAIVAAFGAEGTEVIRKTSDYLNRIAASDKAKATALAGFINEYCPTYPYAVLEFAQIGRCIMTTNGEAYFNTGIKNSNAKRIEVSAYFNQQNRAWIGARNGGTTSALAIGWDQNNKIMYDLATTRINVNAADFVWHYLVLDRQAKKGYLDGTQVATFTSDTISVANDLFLMTINNGGGSPAYWSGNGLIISSAKILEGDTEHWYIPVENNKILDAATGNVINKSGSGTATFSYSYTPTP
jgi:hypothetical protein